MAPALRSRPALVSRSAPAAVSMAFALPGFGGKKQAGPSEEARALYRELGLAEDADYDEINAVYEELEAKYKGDVKRIIKLKVARDKILEDRLRQRMQGTLQANDDVRVASDNFSDEKKPLIKLPRFLERITMFPTKDLMLKNAAVFAFVAFLPVLDKSWASTSLGLGFGVDLFRLFDHRGRDDDGLCFVFFPALLLGDARIGSHGVAEHGIEVNCFEPSGQLGRRLDVLLPEEAHGI